MQDAFGREINYLRLSITDLCNLRCKYCMPKNGIAKIPHKHILTFEEIIKIASAAIALNFEKIRVTGGEVFVRKDSLKLLKKIGMLPGLREYTLTTNGTFLTSVAPALKDAGIQRINVSIDSLDAKKYAQITRIGNLKSVLAGLEAAKKAGLMPIKLNTVLIKGFNDDEIEDFVALTRYEAIDVRFIELMPIGEAAIWGHDKYCPNTFVLQKIPELKKMQPREIASPAEYYQLPGAKGKVGLINPISSHFCHHCNRLRVTSDGRLKPCLHSDHEVDLKEALKKNQSLEKVIACAISEKPKKHRLGSGGIVQRNMSQIGG